MHLSLISTQKALEKNPHKFYTETVVAGKLKPIVEDSLSPLAVASAGEDCDVGVIEFLISNAHWPNVSIKQKTLDHALFHACQKVYL